MGGVEWRHLNFSGMDWYWQLVLRAWNSGIESFPKELFGSRMPRLGGCVRVMCIDSWRLRGGGMAFRAVCTMDSKFTCFRLEEYGRARICSFYIRDL